MTRTLSVFGVIQKWAGIPFDYGADCCQFAGESIQAKTGRNPMAAFNYVDEAGALSLLEKFGGLEQAVTRVLGPPVDAELTTDGDPLLVRVRDARLIGVRWRNRCVLRTRLGVLDWPIDCASKGWTV